MKKSFLDDFKINLSQVEDHNIREIFNLNLDKLKKNYVNVYKETIQNFYDRISELEEQKSKVKKEFIFNKLKVYKPKDKEEKTILFVPVLEQDIYDEYDIIFFVNNNILNKKEKEELINIELDYDIQIARIYKKLAIYLEENKELSRIDKLFELKE
jgi:hypothetical protein